MQLAVFLLYLLNLTRAFKYECKDQINQLEMYENKKESIKVFGSFNNGSIVNCSLGCLTKMTKESHYVNLGFTAYKVTSGCAHDLDFDTHVGQCAYRSGELYCLSHEKHGFDQSKLFNMTWMEENYFIHKATGACPKYDAILSRYNANNEHVITFNQSPETCISGCEINMAHEFDENGRERMKISSGCKTHSGPQMECTIDGDSVQCPYNYDIKMVMNKKQDVAEFMKKYEEIFRPYLQFKGSAAFNCHEYGGTYANGKWKSRRKNTSGSTVDNKAKYGVAPPNSTVKVLRNGVIYYIWICNEINCTTYPNGTSSQPDDTELMWFLGKFGIYKLK